ncbi:SDR family NAD(P)-dependent oxidoreductase [Mycolicibacterium baixiangningiae]|uniref:SDR family NAD(P)-dependent oxidoreductase n=1 Tax=Mycolicibacterium baixiangningiae TaxID=2761578 RepID=UPI0027DA0C26|nr:SDR family NAD(P)-dependent oxidoreductase [Mycolicibacterium baixiangningiae]
MSSLAGKTALVTGATSGIGLAGARALAQDGAYVFLVGRREEALEEAVAGIGAGQASFIRADVTEQSDLDRVSSTIEATGRGLDIVFANAGTAEVAPLGHITWGTTSTRSTPTSAGSSSPCRLHSRCSMKARRSSCAVPPAT